MGNEPHLRPRAARHPSRMRRALVAVIVVAIFVGLLVLSANGHLFFGHYYSH